MTAGLQLRNSECHCPESRALCLLQHCTFQVHSASPVKCLKGKKGQGCCCMEELITFLGWGAVLQPQQNEWDSLWIDALALSLPNLDLVTHVHFLQMKEKKPLWTDWGNGFDFDQFLELTITVISLEKAQICCRNLDGEGDGREKIEISV